MHGTLAKTGDALMRAMPQDQLEALIASDNLEREDREAAIVEQARRGPAVRVGSTVREHGRIGKQGTVTGWEPENSPEWPYLVKWQSGIVEACSRNELAVIAERY